MAHRFVFDAHHMILTFDLGPSSTTDRKAFGLHSGRSVYLRNTTCSGPPQEDVLNFQVGYNDRSLVELGKLLSVKTNSISLPSRRIENELFCGLKKWLMLLIAKPVLLKKKVT